MGLRRGFVHSGLVVSCVSETRIQNSRGKYKHAASVGPGLVNSVNPCPPLRSLLNLCLSTRYMGIK